LEGEGAIEGEGLVEGEGAVEGEGEIQYPPCDVEFKTTSFYALLE
jgi:hypothetical protein